MYRRPGREATLPHVTLFCGVSSDSPLTPLCTYSDVSLRPLFCNPAERVAAPSLFLCNATTLAI